MNNPYFYHPQPSTLKAADAVLKHIKSNPAWHQLFSQGKMLGILVYSREPLKYICAYSGVINGLVDSEHFFVPPVYDLQNPDDFYLQKDAEITSLNQSIASLTLKQEALPSISISIAQQINEQKALRKQLSISLQLEIFRHFDFVNQSGTYKNIVNIFSEAKRGLPPGGSGECAAPRLLQYAYTNGLVPLEIAEFWYGSSPRTTLRVHGQFYPSCIEKCSPILRYMTCGFKETVTPDPLPPKVIASLDILYEDDYLLVVNKPVETLSVPGKVLGESIEEKLHASYPSVKGPMLVHRLDQSTSGLLLAAKDANTHKLLQKDFESRAIHKEYIAWVDGRVESKCGVINLPICPNPDDRPRQTVDFQFGKNAVTYYEVISNIDCRTLLRLVPQTGRTHQLRLHLASHFGLGHSIIGDRIYEGSPDSRLMLHAYRLRFNHPVTNKVINLSIESESFGFS